MKIIAISCNGFVGYWKRRPRMTKSKRVPKVDELMRHMKVGVVYRRSDLKKWSNAVDRHVKELIESKSVQKLGPGIYYCSGITIPGKKAPPDESELIAAFLKDDRFLIITPMTYKGAGLPPTDLHGGRTVYNHKRHGKFTLGEVKYQFRVKPFFPIDQKDVTKEFLLVDIVNNLDLVKDADLEWHTDYVKKYARKVKAHKLEKAIRLYAGASAKKFFRAVSLAE